MQLKSISLENFKGTTKVRYDFDGNMVVSGKNASGKSTISTAHYWLWSDKDYELNSNPDIRPNDGRECEPLVTEILDCDGVQVTFSRKQKLKKSKDGKISLSNSYAINGLAKTAAEVKEFWTAKGIDIDKFIYLSNPNAFMGQNSKEARAMLFDMASEKSDAEIAAEMDGVPEAQELLKSYTLDEIEALQSQEIKTINKEHGKEGELTRAKIVSLETFKTDIDTVSLEKRKSELEQELAQLTSGINATEKEIGDLQTREMRLQFDMSAIAQTMNQEFLTKKRDTEWDLSLNQSELSETQSRLEQLDAKLRIAQLKLEAAESLKEPIDEQYKEIIAKQFDEAKYRITDSDKVCPTCGKPFDESKVAELIAKSEERIKHERDNFLAAKEADKKEVMAKADALKATIADHNKTIVDLGAEIKAANDTVAKLSAKREELQKAYDSYPDSPDFTQNAEYSRLKSEHDEVTAELAKIQNTAPSEVTEGIQEKQQELDNVKAELSKAEQNAQIDERIAQMEKQGKEYEQKRADAEKILYQVKRIKMRKNQTLEDAVNKHFRFTKFQLFKYLKNGEIADDCTPLIDGYSYGKSTNHGRELIAQLDICYSLQRYFKQYVPVFLDNAESLNESNYLKQAETQLICLTVSEDSELNIKKMEV